MSETYRKSLDYARQLDAEDPLAAFRKQFHMPQRNGAEAIYLCGNSLGLQPRSTHAFVTSELKKWELLAVEGHFEGEMPWMTYHKHARNGLCMLTGGLPHEVVAMNNLTTNLHLLLVSFYRPAGKRKKILMEAGAFPSDQYAVESHLRWYGLDPDECIVEVQPDVNEHLHSIENIVAEIERAGDELALVLFSGIQYYTGQFFDIKEITRAAHRVGAIAGFDLAHAIGNVPLQLHEWDADFATWCSYKYLNSGPGGVSGVYIHEKHARNTQIPRFGGWWGHNEAERFKMRKGFDPIPTADGWQLSNAPVLLLAAHLAALAQFEKAGVEQIRNKSIKLTGFLSFLLDQLNSNGTSVRIITPADPAQRGAQLSLFLTDGNKDLFAAITKRGVIADWREPNVIRVAPAPLYNSFEDVFKFVTVLEEEIINLSTAANA